MLELFFIGIGVFAFCILVILALFGIVFFDLVRHLEKHGVYETKKYIWRREKKNA